MDAHPADMKRCTGPKHKGELVATSEFYTVQRRRNYKPGTPGYDERYSYRTTQCRRCRYVQRAGKIDLDGRHRGAKSLQVNGLVPLRRMQGYLSELEARAGSARAACRAVGVAWLSWLRWQGRSDTARKPRYMTRDSAVRVMMTLRRLRAEQRGTVVMYKPHTPRPGYCSGCGCAHNLYVAGCHECAERRSKRARRSCGEDA